MLRNLFARRGDSNTLPQSPDSTLSSPGAAETYATLGPMSTVQFGAGASRIVSPSGALSPVARARAERIMSNPLA